MIVYVYCRFCLFFSVLAYSKFAENRAPRHLSLLYTAALEVFVVICSFSVLCNGCKNMLTSIFDAFANFTAVNYRILNSRHKCKHLFGGENWAITPLPLHSETQTRPGFRRQILHWQNTIFDFLDAQLDFLAIFSSPP